jgi:hypothetical protein
MNDLYDADTSSRYGSKYEARLPGAKPTPTIFQTLTPEDIRSMENKVLQNLSSRDHQSLQELHAEIAFKQLSRYRDQYISTVGCVYVP